MIIYTPHSHAKQLTQIQELQSQLQSKDEQIFELEATAAASSAESKHAARKAEADAEARVHRAEEELRRSRLEAEKYKGSWMRQRKRVAELEAAAGGGAGGSNSGANGAAGGGGQHHRERRSLGGGGGGDAVSHWDARGVGGGLLRGPPADVTLRKVTPTISHEEQADFHRGGGQRDDDADGRNDHSITMDEDDDGESPTKKSVSGTKRKSTDAIKRLPQRAEEFFNAGGIANSSTSGMESARQRLAKHLLTRDEMACYSLPPSLGEHPGAVETPKASMLVESEGDPLNATDGSEAGTGTSQHFRNRARNGAAMQQDAVVERDTRAFVTSVLRQMSEAPDFLLDSAGLAMNPDLSVSGLVHVLLVQFGSLFQHCPNEEREASSDDGSATALDGDGDHAMADDGQHGSACPVQPGRGKFEQQRTALKLHAIDSLLVHKEDVGEGSSLVTYSTVSWRGALYLLRIMHDVLLLSGNAREDLRWWLYQSRQSSPGRGNSAGDRRRSRSPNSDKDVGEGGEGGVGTDTSHPRIEGLPPSAGRTGRWNDSDLKESLWNRNCKPSSAQSPPDDVWDPMTMTQPCNLFFELLVGLMKGNVFDLSETASAAGECLDLRIQKGVVQLAQLEAVELVIALMSDAPPYDHAGDNHGNRTPYLWKFWFDSLLPSSVWQTELSANTAHLGDFLSPWEKRDERCTNIISIGSGRKHSTRLLNDTTSSRSIQQSKRKLVAEKQGRASNRTSRGKSAPDTSTERSEKTDISPSHDDDRSNERVTSILIKCRILQLLSHFMLCSSSVYKSLYETADGESKSSLAKRMLAAILDYMEECIVPHLSAGSLPSDVYTIETEHLLQLCLSCIQFLLIMSRSNDGIRVLRAQMRLESDEDEPSRWSQSAIGCVTLVLDGALSFAKDLEEKENDSVIKSTSLGGALNAIVNRCVALFKALLSFVEEQRRGSSSSKSATLLSLTSEHRTIFQYCCQRILSHQPPAHVSVPPRLLNFSDNLKYDVRDIVEEMVIDAEKDNGN